MTVCIVKTSTIWYGHQKKQDFFSSMSVIKFRRLYPDSKHENRKNRFRLSRRLSQKRYNTGPWLLSITNRKSWIPRSVSRSTTSSDLKGGTWGGGAIVRGISALCAHSVLPTRIEVSQITHVGGACYYGSVTASRPSSQRSQLMGEPRRRTYGHRIWLRTTKFGMVTHAREGRVCRGQAIAPRPKG